MALSTTIVISELSGRRRSHSAGIGDGLLSAQALVPVFAEAAVVMVLYATCRSVRLCIDRWIPMKS